VTLRVVVDTNVCVSAFLFGGKPARFLQLAEDHVFTIVASAPLRTEVERVLANKFGWPKHLIVEACGSIWEIAECVTPKIQLEACPDPDDNLVLECAVEGNADCIVSGDRHLLDMLRFRGITILTVDEFLRSAQEAT